MQHPSASNSQFNGSLGLLTTIRGIMLDAAQGVGFKSVRRSKRTPSQRIQSLEERVVLSVRPLALTGPSSVLVDMPGVADKGGSLQSHVDSELLALAAFESGDETTTLPEITQLFLKNSEGQVGIRATASDVNLVTTQLIGFGFEPTSALPNQHIVEGFIAASSLAQISQAQISGLLGIIPIYRPQTNVGSLTSEATYTMESDRLNNALPTGYNGSGLTIGVLSDSYNSRGGAAADVASGDLPTGVNVLQDISGGSDEGRAMMQLVHDIAPGANLAFATAFTGEAGFAQNIRNLANPAMGNADVIVDDVFYFAEPFFQDGIVAQAVDDVSAAGVPYFSSAGNSADRSFESTTMNFAADTLFPGDSFYDFNTGAAVDTRQSITIGNGVRIRLSFQWDDPFYTVNGVDTDLDIYLVDAGTTNIRASSTSANVANQSPFEILQFTNNTAITGTTNFELIIDRFSGPNPGRLKYVNFGTDVAIEYDTNSSTVVGHAAAAGGQAVGAVPFFNHQTPESFTSFGGTTILFSKTGAPLASADFRATPQIAAVDGNINTFFGQLVDFDGDGTSNRHFFGTSAAAPNAAAVAALVLQANPGFTPAQIYSRLAATAIDVHTPGFDNRTGAGLINAYDAVYQSITPATLTGSGSTISFSDDFELPALSNSWTTNSTGGNRIRVVSNAAFNGTRRLSMDGSSNGFAASGLNETILHVNLAGLTGVQLSFANREFGDEDDAMPASFTGSSNSDGVAMSVDGVNWFRLISLTGTASSGTYQTQTFNLSATAAANSLTLSANTRIKFQQFDNANETFDGIAIDSVVVSANNPQALVVTPTALSVTEGSTNIFSVQLAVQPSSNVTVTVSRTAGDSDISVSGGASLTFTSSNWNIAQTVTLAAAEDLDLANGNSTITVQSSGLPNVDVAASEQDNDSAATFSGHILYNLNAANEKLNSLDQTGQRSMIRNVQVEFNGNLSVPTGAVSGSSFVLTRLGTTPANVGLTVVSRNFAAGKTTLVLGFTSGTQASGSLDDGNYRLVIDYAALSTDGDGDSLVGGTRTINFHRFFGDSDGDRDVDSRDAANYRAGLLGTTRWVSVFDFDNDGSLLNSGLQDNEDKIAFFANYGKLLRPI